jgi:elongation factor G
VGGVEPQSETVWHQADKYKVPKIAFINKMDRVGADFFRAVEMMKERLGAKPLILQLPWGSEDQFMGVIDLLKMKAVVWEDETLGADFHEMPIPQEMIKQALRYREALLEAVADKDDEVMAKYLAEEEIEVQDLRRVIRDAAVRLEAVPVLCGAALRNKGIQPLLDALVDFLPSPSDIPPVVGHVPSTSREVSRRASSKDPFSALAFKVQMDQGRKLTYLRIYSGSIRPGTRSLILERV